MEKHLKSSDFIKDIVIGMSDGLTVPFALAAGLSGAVSNTDIIATAGIAEIVAGSIAMGLGGYLAGQTEVEHYDAELRREYEEVERVPETEKDYGLDEAAQNLIVEALSKDKDKWVDFMMKFELGLEKPDINRARNSALTIGLSYIVGGILPLSPYFFVEDAHEGLRLSVVLTLITLFVFGFFKSKVTDQNPWTGALKVMLIGAAAAGAAFYVAKVFS
jgi:vacuolar iron transporter family protein